jgi:prostaglandin-H2 D-isomerase / glutathione transferase
MNPPRVTYFDFAGSRGEEVRLALVLAGVEFEDRRLKRDEYAALKPNLPFPHVPTLEIEGQPVLGHSNAILRLIGRLHGLYPEDPFEAARHDAIMEAVEDFRHRLSPSMRMTDPADKLAAREAVARDYIPQWGRGIEAMIGAGRFAGGERPGVADLKLHMIDRWITSGGLDGIPPDALDPFPRIRAASQGVAELPAVTGWNAKRGG